jgi:hypothetical protein
MEQQQPNTVPLQQQPNLSKIQTNKSNKANNKSQVITNNAKPESLKSSITKKVSLKYYRKQAVERVGKVTNILPQFIKFIKKLSPDQIAALKYYKGPGSFFQTDIIINHNNTAETEKQKKNMGRSQKKTHELYFPFDKYEDEMLQEDILGSKVSLQYPLWLPNMTNIPSYINNSYGIRIKLLNILDTVFKHPDCPKLTANTILFRGMSDVPDKKKIKAGETFEFKNFISTTYDRLVAERFSDNGYVFVLTGFNDVPCVYTPNLKGIANDYESAVLRTPISNDLSELTLPRGLEFKIDKVEQRHTSERRNIFMMGNMGRKTHGYQKLITALKKQGLTPDDVDNKIEDTIFNKVTFVYCTFVKWTPGPELDFKKIKKTAKFVLDTESLKSWDTRQNDLDVEDD